MSGDAINNWNVEYNMHIYIYLLTELVLFISYY